MLCAESYPDECWMFCNTVALAAVRVGDRLDDQDHSAFFAEWVAHGAEQAARPEDRAARIAL